MRSRFVGLTRWVSPGALLILAACASEHPQTMLEPVTEYGHITNDLWGWVTWWTVGIMVVVFGALAYILVRFRGKPGDPTPKPVYGSTSLELTWTLIPAVITYVIMGLLIYHGNRRIYLVPFNSGADGSGTDKQSTGQ